MAAHVVGIESSSFNGLAIYVGSVSCVTVFISRSITKCFSFVRLQLLFILVHSICANVVSFRLKGTADVFIRNPCLVVLFFFFFLRNVHAACPEQCPLRKEANFDFRNATKLAWHSLTKQNMGDSEGCIYSGATFILQVPGR